MKNKLTNIKPIFGQIEDKPLKPSEWVKLYTAKAYLAGEYEKYIEEYARNRQILAVKVGTSEHSSQQVLFSV
jgi:hypothetical protein